MTCSRSRDRECRLFSRLPIAPTRRSPPTPWERMSSRPWPRFRSLKRFANILTGPGVDNWDLAIEKNILLREPWRLQIRSEFFNAWNHAQFANPDSTVGDANFGQVTQARPSREIQIGLKLLW